MPKKNHYITEEYLERRLDERFAEQADLIQRGFSDVADRFSGVDDRFSGLENRFSRLEVIVHHLVDKVENGFNKLDEYTGSLKRLDEAEAMNQAAHRRYDDRLTSLETRPTVT
ncbi:MAG: hypothetical protein AAB974_01500 [Patescibacteria group bacterium]